MPQMITDSGETVEIEREIGPVKLLQRGAVGLVKDAGLADRQVKCVVSTPSVDRAGDIIEVGGIDLGNYKANPVVLLQHDANRPVAKCVMLGLEGGKLVAVAEFPEPGISADADRVYGLIKAGIIGAVSIGVLPKEWTFINDKRPWDGTKYIKSEMLEFSFVALPMNAEALVIGRSAGPEAEAQRAALIALAKATEEVELEAPEAPPTETESAPESACVDDGEHAKQKAARLRTVEVLRSKALL